MSKQQPTATVPQKLLLKVIGLCVGLGFFVWFPNSLETLWQRRLYIYLAGGLSLFYIWAHRAHIRFPKRVQWLLLGLLIVSSLSLLTGSNIVQGLIGQPIGHPSLLSLYVSMALGLLFALLPAKERLFRYIYGFLLLFGLANLAYWLVHGVSMRLGLIGEQVNYTAGLLLVGLVIGNWLYLNKKLPSSLAWFSQSYLLILLLLTQSRAAIGLALACLVYLTFRANKHKQRFLLSISAVGLVALATLIAASLFSRINNGHYFARSVQYRADLVLAALPRSPSTYLLGGGIGSLEHNIGTYGHEYAPINNDLSHGWRFESSHNYLIDILVERGVLVLIAFGWLMFEALRLGFGSRDSERKLLAFILLITSLFTLVNNINVGLEVIIWTCMICLLILPVGEISQ